MMTIVFGTVLPWLLIAIGTWLAYQLVRQNGRILLRLETIEEQIGISENAKNTFRQEILIRISSHARKGKPFEYNSHERLKEAIEKKIFADLKDVVKITTSTKTPDPDQLRRINEVIDRLVKEHGYCPVCANELLTYVGTLLSR